ncbi:MAG: glycosyltransferase family 39 protein [Candidatus Woesearchaeota archaeon]
MKKETLLGIVISIAYFLFLIVQIPDYGITWDEPIQYTSGIAYANYFSGKPLVVGNISNVANYGPFVDILGAYSYIVFSKNLGWTDPITAHRIPVALLAALAVLVVYLFTLRNYNLFVAISSALFLLIYPHFFAHAHFNVKDVPMAGLYTIAIILFYEATLRKSWKWSIGAGIVLGLAGATKINAAFIPITIVLWWVIAFRDSWRKNGKLVISKRWDLLASFLIAIPVTIIAWPWLWHSTIAHIQGILKTFSTVALGFVVFYFGQGYQSGVNVPWHYPFGYLAVVTPLIMLIMAAIGFFIACKDTASLKNRASALVLVWFLVATLKISFSGLVYDGIRQFFEVVPALAILAGIGAWFCFRVFHGFAKNRLSPVKSQVAFGIILLLLLWPTLNAMARLHPYESSYHNALVGGTQGAVGKFRVSYWGEPIKAGIEWLNKNAEKNATVNVVEAPHLAIYYVRKDLNVVTGEGGNYVLTLNAFPTQPIYTVFADGVPILNIYKGNPNGNITPYDIMKSDDLFFKQEMLSWKQECN